MAELSRHLWLQGEALARRGERGAAMGAFVDAAVAEEQAGRPLRALAAWEAIARRFGASGHVFERCARICQHVELHPSTYIYWAAAAATYRREHLEKEAYVATTHALILREEGLNP